jgi:hypothetical protein
VNLNYITTSDAVAAAIAVKNTKASAQDVADPGTTTDAGKVPQVTADDLYSKILKFIPAPLLGIYLMATNVIIEMAPDNQKPNQWLLLGALVLFVVATIAFLKVRKVRTSQVWMSATAFVVFAMGSPGWFQYQGWWRPGVATLALILAAGLIVVFEPKTPLPPD